MAILGRFGLLKQLVPLGTKRFYSKKRTILFQGEVPRSVLLLQKGVVRVYGITSSGDERTVTLLTEGDVFPMTWVAGKTGVSMYYYEALTDCNVVAVAKDLYDETVERLPALREQIYKNYLGHYVGATMHIYALEQSHAQDKLAYILQYLVTRFGEKLTDGRFKIGLRLSHQDIAEMVGVTRETTAVELNRLKRQGYIEYHKFTYIVDQDKLIRLTGGDEFVNAEID